MSLMKKRAATVVLACATGCVHPPLVKELTPEQKQIVESVIMHLQTTASFHAALVERAKEQAVFDSQGEHGALAYQESLSEAVDLAGQLQKEGRIFGYEASKATGFYTTSHAFFETDDQGPYIGLNLEGNVIENLTSSSILHEVMHDQYPSHSPAVSEEVHGIQSDFDYQDSSFVQLVLEQQDLPYLASLYGDVSDTATWYAQAISMEALTEIYEKEGKTPEEIYALLLEQPIAQEKKVWVHDVLDGIYSDYLTTLGISKDELRLTLIQSDVFYEPAHEVYLEDVERYYAQHTEAQEHSSERRRM